MSVGAKSETSATPYDRSTVFNVPNQLTTLRLLLSIVLFVLMTYERYTASMIIFVIAAGTDWIDGYWARKYGQVTTLGRILDPFVDKVIICGTYIFLAAAPGSHVQPWMVVVIVGRELLVTALRSFLEQQGSDFSASMSGKLKFVLQCALATGSLYLLSYNGSTEAPPSWAPPTLDVIVWATLLMTVYSGVAYIFAALRLYRPEK